MEINWILVAIIAAGIWAGFGAIVGIPDLVYEVGLARKSNEWATEKTTRANLVWSFVNYMFTWPFRLAWEGLRAPFVGADRFLDWLFSPVGSKR